MGYDARFWQLADDLINGEPQTKNLPDSERSDRTDSMAKALQSAFESELAGLPANAAVQGPAKEAQPVASVGGHTLTGGCGQTGCRGCGLCDSRPCNACGLFGAALTTDCCGQEVTASATGKICDGELDYRGGQWVRAKNPAQQEVNKIRQRNRNAVQGGHAGAYR